MNRTKGEERYRRIVESIDRLPSLPSIAARLIDVVNSPESSADDAAELIEKDPALTTKILRLANSAFYGMPRSISSVSSAVVILGFNTIRSVALSATIVKMFPKGTGAAPFDYMRFWRHSIVSAMVARSIARRLFNFMMLDPEGAFCAGLLHDIGRLIFQQYVPEDCVGACELARTRAIPLIEAEMEVMGITHARIGSILADKWALPIDLENALVFHHEPQAATSGKELVATIHLADIICHAIDVDLWDGEVAPKQWGGIRSYLKMEDVDYASLVEEARENIVRSEEYFAIIR